MDPREKNLFDFEEAKRLIKGYDKKIADYLIILLIILLPHIHVKRIIVDFPYNIPGQWALEEIFSEIV